MAVTIAASVGAAMSAATGRSNQGHLQYAANQGAWWLLYLTSTGSLSALYSSDFTSWTAPIGSPFTLAGAHNNEGRHYAFSCRNISSNDVLHMVATRFSGTTPNITATASHARFTLGTTWTVTNAEATTGTAATNWDTVFSPILLQPATVLDSVNRPVDANPAWSIAGSKGNMEAALASNADSGTSWTAGYATPVEVFSVPGTEKLNALFSLGGTSLLYLGGNAPDTLDTFTDIEWSKYTGTWSATATALASAVTSTSNANVGACALSTSDIHLVALSNNSNTFVHRRFNGTAWATGNTVPNLTPRAGGGIALASDGTDVWAFAVDGSNNVQYVKWTASTPAWGSWAVLDAGGASARTSIVATYSAVTNTIGVVWTEANGGNFDIAGATLNTGAPPEAPPEGGASTGTGMQRPVAQGWT